MGEGIIVRRGGGAGLNFKVTQVASAGALPAAPQENEIAVITNTDIAGGIFDTAPPASAAAGTVFCYTYSRPGAATFNASKDAKTAINLTPYGVMQYVSGAWAAREAYIRRESAWVSLTYLLLYDLGETFTSLTGGWQKHIDEGGNSYANNVLVNPTGNAQRLLVETIVNISSGTSSAWGRCTGGTNNAILLTEIKRLIFNYDISRKHAFITNENYWDVSFGIKSSKTGPWVARTRIAGPKIGVGYMATLDVSAYSGSYYVEVETSIGRADYTTLDMPLTMLVSQIRGEYV